MVDDSNWKFVIGSFGLVPLRMACKFAGRRYSEERVSECIVVSSRQISCSAPNSEDMKSVGQLGKWLVDSADVNFLDLAKCFMQIPLMAII